MSIYELLWFFGSVGIAIFGELLNLLDRPHPKIQAPHQRKRWPGALVKLGLVSVATWGIFEIVLAVSNKAMG